MARKTNKEYADVFCAAVERSPEAGALALVGITTQTRLSDKGPNNTIRNLGHAFKHALKEIQPHLDGGVLSSDQMKAIELAEESLMTRIYSY